MLFSVDKKILERPLQLMGNIVSQESSGSPNSAVLTNCLMEVNAGKISLTGTNLEVEVNVWAALPKQAEEVSCKFGLPAKTILNLFRLLPEETSIDFEIKGDKLTIKNNKDKYQFNLLAEFEEIQFFNPMEPTMEFKIKADKFLTLLKYTSFAMAQNDARYYLNGMLFEMTSEHFRAVATDGHRLACATLPEPITQSDKKNKTQIIVPRKAVIEMAKLLEGKDEATLSLDENLFRVSVGDSTLTTKLIDGKYPDYGSVIPKEGEREKTLNCDRVHFLGACRRAAVVSEVVGGYIQLQASESTPLSIEGYNGSVGSQQVAEIFFDGVYKGSAIEISFKASYLQDVMNILEGSSVELLLQDNHQSVVIRDPQVADVSYVVMPLHI